MSHRARVHSARNVGLLVLLTAVVTAGAPSVIHIRQGDTLSGLAAKHHTTVGALQKANHLTGTTIYVGELIRIPGNQTPPAGKATARTTTTVKHVYTVRSGDNLTRLATRFHTTNAKLIALNRLRTSTVFIGQHLIYATTTTAGTQTNAGKRIPVSVQRSAAQHRRQLRASRLPSKAQVRAMIAASARRHKVPTPLALALAYQESGFQQRVVSPVDAIGVMQVLPSTGRSLGRMHGRTYDLMKASENIEAGVTLLRDLLNATGSPAKALAGYYQGLGSVRRIGLLPQTKAYIKNITLMQKRFR